MQFQIRVVGAISGEMRGDELEREMCHWPSIFLSHRRRRGEEGVEVGHGVVPKPFIQAHLLEQIYSVDIALNLSTFVDGKIVEEV